MSNSDEAKNYKKVLLERFVKGLDYKLDRDNLVKISDSKRKGKITKEIKDICKDMYRNGKKKIDPSLTMEMQEYYDSGKSILDVSKKFGVSIYAVSRKLKMKTRKIRSSEKYRIVLGHKVKRKVRKLSKRKQIQEELLKYKGNKCGVCGYDTAKSSLKLIYASGRNSDFTTYGKKLILEDLKEEVDKCVIVCSNCHREVKEGIVKITDKE